MKLSKLYSNMPMFGPIDFIDSLNVVMAEIRLPENRNKDTHNLGKSTLGRVLDFMFLLGKEKSFFLFKHFDIFKDYVFFLEIQLANASYITVRRGVDEATKISFKKHQSAHQDFTTLSDSEWDHLNMPFDRAREMLDSLLDWRGIKPWSYRNGIGYLLRSQDDFRDVFHLKKFGGAHSDWKPFLAHMLGFRADLIVSHYAKETDLKAAEEKAHVINSELGGTVKDISKVEGLLLLKKQDAEKKEGLLSAFDFRAHDTQLTKQVVDDIDDQIATLNNQRYSLSQNLKKILASLQEEQLLFSTSEAERLFREAGVLFEGQIKRDFNQLLDFNRAITDERRAYLDEERIETESELKTINSELNALGKRRSEALAFLSSTDIFNKYKEVSDELVTLRADIAGLERQREFLRRLQQLRTEIRTAAEHLGRLQTSIEEDVEKQNADGNSLFSSIRVFFSEIVEYVIDRKALLSVSPNQLGHLDFKVEILDSAGQPTSADTGHTYRKLLCIAFDLAVLRPHLNDLYPRFVYHDGVFESLDDRKKSRLLEAFRQYAELGLQPIITLIDSDLPPAADKETPVFAEGEIVVRLHDENDDGRLFRIPAW